MAASAPTTIDTVLSNVSALLDQSRCEDALNLISHCGINSIRLANARGVCLLRIGRVEQALAIFRDLVYPRGAFSIPDGTPAEFQANYVSALLAAGNITIAKSLLGQIDQQGHPSIVKIKDAMARWRKSVGLVARAKLLLGGPLTKPVLDYAPGDL
ncbi:MAG: hypothetical protein ABFD92_08210 [Planctomycetaceae bacterium]|nr:hypothetical protein [Planctomycetaceae bacterium]